MKKRFLCIRKLYDCSVYSYKTYGFVTLRCREWSLRVVSPFLSSISASPLKSIQQTIDYLHSISLNIHIQRRYMGFVVVWIDILETMVLHSRNIEAALNSSVIDIIITRRPIFPRVQPQIENAFVICKYVFYTQRIYAHHRPIEMFIVYTHLPPESNKLFFRCCKVYGGRFKAMLGELYCRPAPY